MVPVPNVRFLLNCKNLNNYRFFLCCLLILNFKITYALFLTTLHIFFILLFSFTVNQLKRGVGSNHCHSLLCYLEISSTKQISWLLLNTASLKFSKHGQNAAGFLAKCNMNGLYYNSSNRVLIPSETSLAVFILWHCISILFYISTIQLWWTGSQGRQTTCSSSHSSRSMLNTSFLCSLTFLIGVTIYQTRKHVKGGRVCFAFHIQGVQSTRQGSQASRSSLAHGAKQEAEKEKGQDLVHFSLVLLFFFILSWNPASRMASLTFVDLLFSVKSLWKHCHWLTQGLSPR